MGVFGGIVKITSVLVDRAGIADTIRGSVTDSVGGIVGSLTDQFTNALKDTFHSMFAKKQTVQQWAQIAADGVDKIIQRAVSENNWHFFGGKLKFAVSEKNCKKVDISFELYFQDEDKLWQKMGATGDVYLSVFTDESIAELQSGSIEFDVEE